MTEKEWDQKLHIETIGRDASMEDNYHYPYEPTPYTVLERMAESGYLTSSHKLIDYGCGKGRVGFFLNHSLGCEVIGIEFDTGVYEQAKRNLHNYQQQFAKMESTLKICPLAAEKYKVTDENAFYFFNPFSVEILKGVIGKIINSYYESPREMLLFFYYPSDEYISYLMTVDELCFVDEIDCRDLFEGGNDRERIVIFEIL